MGAREIGADELTRYWDDRSDSYHDGVAGELADGRRDAWDRALDPLVQPVLEAARLEGRVPRVLDLGCGPGFFCVLFAARGCEVVGVDVSASMLERASQNIAAESYEDQVELACCDVASLPFSEGAFDLAIARNLTWTLLDPEGAYAEWLRVLRPAGKLLVFDANWYRYLLDPKIAEARRADQALNVLEGWDESAQATSDEERRFEKTAANLPLTPVLRPEWDLDVLHGLGASAVGTDREIWKSVWTPNERAYYGSTPMFLVEATK